MTHRGNHHTGAEQAFLLKAEERLEEFWNATMQGQGHGPLQGKVVQKLRK